MVVTAPRRAMAARPSRSSVRAGVAGGPPRPPGRTGTPVGTPGTPDGPSGPGGRPGAPPGRGAPGTLLGRRHARSGRRRRGRGRDDRHVGRTRRVGRRRRRRGEIEGQDVRRVRAPRLAGDGVVAGGRDREVHDRRIAQRGAVDGHLQRVGAGRGQHVDPAERPLRAVPVVVRDAVLGGVDLDQVGVVVGSQADPDVRALGEASGVRRRDRPAERGVVADEVDAADVGDAGRRVAGRIGPRPAGGRSGDAGEAGQEEHQRRDGDGQMGREAGVTPAAGGEGGGRVHGGLLEGEMGGARSDARVGRPGRHSHAVAAWTQKTWHQPLAEPWVSGTNSPAETQWSPSHHAYCM